jgi:hypothetical protein
MAIFAVRCTRQAIEKIKVLLNSEDSEEFYVVVNTLPWIASDQSVPLLLEFSTKLGKFSQQILAVHRDWLENGLMTWLTKLQKKSPEKAQNVCFRLQEFVSRQELAQDVINIVDKLFSLSS